MNTQSGVTHGLNSSTQEAETNWISEFRPGWSAKLVPGKSGLYQETVSNKQK